MDILGIGPLEVIFILVIALIIFGPNDLIQAGKSAGKFFRKVVKSSEWSTFQQASKEVRSLPTRLMREAGIDEMENEIGSLKPPKVNLSKSALDAKISSWVTTPATPQSEAPPLVQTPPASATESEPQQHLTETQTES